MAKTEKTENEFREIVLELKAILQETLKVLTPVTAESRKEQTATSASQPTAPAKMQKAAVNE